MTRLAAAELPLRFPLRARAALIERDLLSLGLSPADLPTCLDAADLPQLSCPEDLAGCLYVLEGACLGGQVIGPLLRERLGLAKGAVPRSSPATRRGRSRDGAVFVAWLEGLTRAGSATAEIVRASAATFEAFARWGSGRLRDRGETPWLT